MFCVILMMEGEGIAKARTGECVDVGSLFLLVSLRRIAPIKEGPLTLPLPLPLTVTADEYGEHRIAG